jgi:hypothetical protein
VLDGYWRDKLRGVRPPVEQASEPSTGRQGEVVAPVSRRVLADAQRDGDAPPRQQSGESSEYDFLDDFQRVAPIRVEAAWQHGQRNSAAFAWVVWVATTPEPDGNHNQGPYTPRPPSLTEAGAVPHQGARPPAPWAVRRPSYVVARLLRKGLDPRSSAPYSQQVGRPASCKVAASSLCFLGPLCAIRNSRPACQRHLFRPNSLDLGINNWAIYSRRNEGLC